MVPRWPPFYFYWHSTPPEHRLTSMQYDYKGQLSLCSVSGFRIA
jgi:hypothetical protein